MEEHLRAPQFFFRQLARLIEAIETHVRLEHRNENGVKERAFAERGARKGNAAMRALLDAERGPACLDYLAAMFWRLDGMRVFDMNGTPHRFTPGFIEDGARLFGWSLSTMEAEAIVMLDTARVNAEHTARENAKPKKARR